MDSSIAAMYLDWIARGNVMFKAIKHIFTRWDATRQGRRRVQASSRELVQAQASADDPGMANARWQEIAYRLQHGQLAAAELDLHDWHRHADCPSQATLLLASLLARRGQKDAARQVMASSSSPRTGASDHQLTLMEQELRISLLVQDGLNDAARRQAWHYHHHQGHRHDTRLWLQAMDVPGSQVCEELPQQAIDSLAVELIKHWRLLATLVTAQKIKPDAQQIRLLRAAGLRCHRDMDKHRSGYQLCLAMAELALLVQDGDDARRWAYRGLKIEPYSAELALILSHVEDDPAYGPAASQVLEQAVAAHPEYPDLMAALIRREMAQGKKEQARQRLEQWMQRQPQHPMALHLVREMAA